MEFLLNSYKSCIEEVPKWWVVEPEFSALDSMRAPKFKH